MVRFDVTYTSAHCLLRPSTLRGVALLPKFRTLRAPAEAVGAAGMQTFERLSTDILPALGSGAASWHVTAYSCSIVESTILRMTRIRLRLFRPDVVVIARAVQGYSDVPPAPPSLWGGEVAPMALYSRPFDHAKPLLASRALHAHLVETDGSPVGATARKASIGECATLQRIRTLP